MGHSTLTLKMGLGRPRGERDTPKPLSAGDAGRSSALSPPDDVRAGLSKPSLPKEGLSLVWVGGKKQKQQEEELSGSLTPAGGATKW